MYRRGHRKKMKPFQFILFEKLLDECKPTFIGEIGSHNGNTSEQMCRYVLSRTKNSLLFQGYDAYDLVLNDEEFAIKEKNGKGPGNYEKAMSRMNKIRQQYSGRFNYKLIKGFTNETITTPIKFDFVYIDAGHSYDSVKHDYEMVKESKIIVFDDYCMPGVNQLIKEIEQSGIVVECFDNTDTSRAVAVVRNIK